MSKGMLWALETLLENVARPADEEITHRTCGACYPSVKLGDTVKTRCGLSKVIRRIAPDTTCVVCRDMTNRFPCGPDCAADRSVQW